MGGGAEMMEGDITTIDLLARLVELGRERFTGAIRFENDGIIKILYLKGGDILSASTNDRADSVDELLLRAGKVTREHVKQALAKRKENETLGDALLNLGFITRKELTWGRRVQVISVIRSVRSWTAGTYTIVADYLPKREEGTLFPLQQIIVELIVTEQDRSEIERALSGGTAVFKKASDFDSHYRGLGLNEDADAVAAEIDGERNASEVASLAGRDTFNVYKLLRAFAVLGLTEEARAAQAEPQYAAVSASSVPADDLLSADGVADAEDVWKSSLPGTAAVPAMSVAAVSAEEFVEAPTLEIPMKESLPPDRPKTLSTPMPPPPRRATTQSRPLSGRQVLSAPKKSPSSRTPLIIVVLLLLLGGAAYAGWQWWQSKRTVSAAPVVRTATKHPLTKPVASNPAPVIPEPPPVTATVATTSSVATSSKVPAPVPVPAKPAPAPAKPVAKPAKPTVEPTPMAVTLAPAPGKYADMAREYERTANNTYTVQFELVCQESSLGKAVEAGGQKIWFVPISYRGQSCYRVFWGRFDTREAAALAVPGIPRAIRGASPAIVRVP